MQRYEDLSFESVACPAGCPPGDKPVLTGHDTLHQLEGTFTIVACRTCGLARTSPRPDSGSIGFYYPSDYAPYTVNRQNSKTESKASGLRGRIKKALRVFLPGRLTKFLPQPGGGRLLEVGCSAGDFLDEAAKLGWQVEGIEFSDQAAGAARAKGHAVQTGQLETVALDPNQYDIVVGWMVLEHLHDPQAALINLFDTLKPGGSLVVSVPNFSAWSRFLFGRHWYCLQLPTHLYHYNRKTLSHLLARAGFGDITVEYSANAKDFFLSLSILLREKGFPGSAEKVRRWVKKAGWKMHLFLPIAFLVSIFRGSSRMTLVARKP